MLRFMSLVCFLASMTGCMTELNHTKSEDGGTEEVGDGLVRLLDGEVDDAGRETPDAANRSDAAIADAHIESDAQAPIPDANTRPGDASLPPDAQRDAQVQADSGDTPDAAPIADATSPLPDAASACENDRNCGPAGGICTGGTCRVTREWMVWCWDHTPPDGRPTCHNVDGYSSPDVWRLADHPDGPPACQGPNPDHFPVAECCRGSREWNNEESDDFRWCEQQPDGSSMTWNPYNDD